MDPDLRNLVLDRVHHVVQLQENIYFDDSVMKRI